MVSASSVTIDPLLFPQLVQAMLMLIVQLAPLLAWILTATTQAVPSEDEKAPQKSGAERTFVVSLPSYWTEMPPAVIFQQVEIKLSDPEYVAAARLFTVKGTLHHIYRIQNPTLFTQFTAEKLKMHQVYANHEWNSRLLPLNERLLYHGTKRENVKDINMNGFDRSYANAAVYGFGSYFARDMSYSAEIRFSPPDTAGHKYVYVARVLVGMYCTANTESMDRPPKQSNGLSFDSVVDSLYDPSVFVIFRDTRAYPEYLYEFS